MMDHPLQYSNLKNNVLKEAGASVSLEQLKEHFSTSINSRRALSRVKSLKCIIQLLEERDMLNWRNVECLKQIGDLLQNNKIGELVQCYKKLEDIEEKLCICGEPIQQDENQCLIENNNNVVINLVNPGLADAIRNISQRIGKKWPYLARELDISEYHRDRISNQFPKDFESQAKAALDLWVSKVNENDALDVLDKALNARHCKRHGIGSFMCSPI